MPHMDRVVIGTVTCWSPGCTEQLEQLAGRRARLYCDTNCRVKAYRVNGNKAPTEPMPPYGPDATVFSAGTPEGKPDNRRSARSGVAAATGPTPVMALVPPPPEPEPPEEPELLRLVRLDLEKVGQADTWKGQQALAAAARLTAATTSASSHATLNKELDRIMAELTGSVTRDEDRDPSETIRERVRLKLLRTDAS